MEERFDDTVELIDYLRVIWWGKWIILGCFVAAVGLSSLFVGLQPTTYKGSTEILLREYVTAALSGHQGEMSSPTRTISLMMVMEFALAAVKTDSPAVTASLEGDRITLSQSNAKSTDAVREALAQAEAALERELPLALADELKHLAVEAQFQRNSLEAQLGMLRLRLGDDQASSTDFVPEALAERIAELEAQLAEKLVCLDTLETSELENLFVLSSISEPTIVASESNLKTRIAVAGFLGLMIGVLLTFFLHYLLQIRARERQAS